MKNPVEVYHYLYSIDNSFILLDHCKSIDRFGMVYLNKFVNQRECQLSMEHYVGRVHRFLKMDGKNSLERFPIE